MPSDHPRASSLRPLLFALVAVGLALSPLWVAYEPIGFDPDLLYRPIKAELGRALRQGRLPYWDDRFSVGIPLVAESHVAAFYPPNWLLYGTLDVAPAYRVSMWLHYVLLAATTFAYARRLGIMPWGAAVSAVSFALGGFAAVHAGHEPFYHVLPFLPLALLLADLFVASGRWVWLALLALTWGVQVLLGHFHLQMITAALVLVTGTWRVVADRLPWSRAAGLALGLAWGAAVAAVQLAPSGELARFVGQARRSPTELMCCAFPPAHWAQLALPRLFLGQPGVTDDPYWRDQGLTTGTEVGLYLGTVPLILAFAGMVAGLRDRKLAPWWGLIAVGWFLASLRLVSEPIYISLLSLPGYGTFRAPARYVVLVQLGLCLFAGRGLDRTISAGRFRLALGLALLFGAGAAAWGVFRCSHDPTFIKVLGPVQVQADFASAALAWAVALVVVLAWRRGRVGPLALVLVATVELGLLFYWGPTRWGWSLDLPAEGPVLSALAREPGVRRVAAPLGNLPIRSGVATALPLLGFEAPPPYRVLMQELRGDLPGRRNWYLRLGITHGVTPYDDSEAVLYEGPDPTLDRLSAGPFPPGHIWRVVRHAPPFPEARVALRAVEARHVQKILNDVAQSSAPDEVYFLRGDLPPPGSDPPARSARLLRWDGRSATVAHDGLCYLVLARTYYPGWTAQVNGGPDRPIYRVDRGLQAVRLTGSGVSRVVLRYRPWWAKPAATVSALAIGAAFLVLGIATARRWMGLVPES